MIGSNPHVASKLDTGMSMEPRELTFASFSEVPAELDKLQRGYQKLGQWDLAQVCDHLNYFIEGPMDGWKFKVPWLIKVLLGRKVLNRVLRERRMKRGVFTPQKPLPAPGGDESAAVERLKKTIARFLAHPGPFHPSPFFGEMTIEQLHELNLLHCAHHLAYLAPKT